MGKGVGARRLVLESAAIVASILLAFALDAGWDNRQLHHKETAVLEQMLVEFESEAQQLEQNRTLHERVALAARSLLDLMGRPGSAPEDELSSLVFSLVLDPTFQSAGGVLLALSASGDLALIDDPILRAELAAWPGRVADMQEKEAVGVRQKREQVLPYLDRAGVSLRTVLAQVAPTDLRFFGTHEVPEAGSFPSGVRSVLMDRSFENHLINRYTDQLVILARYDELLETSNRIRQLIEKRLGG